MMASRLLGVLDWLFPSTPRHARTEAAAATQISFPVREGKRVPGTGQTPAPASGSTPWAGAGQTPEGERAPLAPPPGVELPDLSPSGPPAIETDLFWDLLPEVEFDTRPARVAAVLARWKREGRA